MLWYEETARQGLVIEGRRRRKGRGISNIRQSSEGGDDKLRSIRERGYIRKDGWESTRGGQWCQERGTT